MTRPPQTSRLLQRWVDAAPERARAVSDLLLGSGIAAGALAEALQLKVGPPTSLRAWPTFDRARGRAPTPMLKARLAFAGTMSDGLETWPGGKALEQATRRTSVARQLRAVREHWQGAAVAKAPPSALSLFGFAPDDPTRLVLLDWSKGAEPRVVRYSGQDERVFPHLDAFLRWASAP